MSKDRQGEVLSLEKVESFLRHARQIFPSRDFVVGSTTHTISDLHELELVEWEEQVAVLTKVLAEICAENYIGPHPPRHLSDEPRCKGARMLQFKWTSACFDGNRMYVKFCIVDERLVLLRIHPDYEPNRFAKLERQKRT